MKNNFTIKEVRGFWDRVAFAYDSLNQKISDIHLQRFEEAIKFIQPKKGSKILNVWSRTGLAIPYLKKKCPDSQIFNLEVSQNFINIAKKRFPEQNFELTDLDKFNFKNDFFDFILSLETLEHTPDPQILLAEFFRVLKSDGILIMSVPPSTAEWSLKVYEFFWTNHGEGPHKFLSSKTIKKNLKEAGFKILFHKGTVLLPVNNKWLRKLGEKIINRFQNTFIKELGIRQFYVCKK